jgi:hypothetical protein
MEGVTWRRPKINGRDWLKMMYILRITFAD